MRSSKLEILFASAAVCEFICQEESEIASHIPGPSCWEESEIASHVPGPSVQTSAEGLGT